MKYIIKYKLSFIIASAILYLSLFKPPKLDFDIDIVYLDKIIHIVMYAVLSTSLLFESDYKNNNVKNFIIFIICTIFGGVIELLQNYFPPRTASWGDLFADAIGSALPLVIITFIWIYDNGHKQNGKADSIKPN